MKKVGKTTAAVLALMLMLGGCGGGSSSTATSKKAETSGAPAAQATGDANFPSKPIELYVPYSPGGQTDLAARALAKNVSKYLPNNQSVVVINVAGASGMTGANQFFSTPADGYTLLMSTNSPVTLFPTTEEIDYKYENIRPLMQVITMPQCMQTKSGSKWGNGGGKEWLDELKSEQKVWKYGTVGLGNGQHLSVEAMARAVGIKTEPVSFGSLGEGQTAVMQGSVDGVIGAPINWDPTQTDILICMAKERSKQYPDIPTLRELGYDFSIEFFVGLFCQAGVPEDHVKIITEAFRKALEDPDTVAVIEKIPMQIAYLDATEFKKYCDWELDTYATMAKELDFVK